MGNTLPALHISNFFNVRNLFKHGGPSILYHLYLNFYFKRLDRKVFCPVSRDVYPLNSVDKETDYVLSGNLIVFSLQKFCRGFQIFSLLFSFHVNFAEESLRSYNLSVMTIRSF